MEHFSFSDFRQHFPILDSLVNDCSLVYFDNAATTQKPSCVIACHADYYQKSNANVHRASHALSAKATSAYEAARVTAQHFINADNYQEIIWTKGTTEGINLVSQSWGRNTLQPGDEIVLSYSEHHANIVPWQIVAQQTGAKIKLLALTKSGQIDVEQLENTIGERTRIVCFGHISNVVGKVNPINDIIRHAKKFNALTLIDGAQAIGHIPVDVKALNCDFYVFSAHKMYGPTGVGVLYGRQSLLKEMLPYQAGGEMIKAVSFERTTYNDLPHKFEAGTPNIAGVVAFGATIDFIEAQGHQGLFAYETQLKNYCFEQLKTVKGLTFTFSGSPDIPLFSFTLAGQHNHDVAAALDSVGIALRSGHHCAMPLMQYLNISGCIRLSLSAYNSLEEVDFAIQQLKIISNALPDKPIGTLKAVSSKALPNSITGESFLTVQQVITLFTQAKGWDSKHREIMMLGKKHVRMASENRTEQALIAGCESHAWLVSTKDNNNLYQFKADSDAKVIRGLLVIILAAVNNKSAAEIKAFDMEEYFIALGLVQHLSPSRGNGLRAIVNKIYSIIDH